MAVRRPRRRRCPHLAKTTRCEATRSWLCHRRPVSGRLSTVLRTQGEGRVFVVVMFAYFTYCRGGRDVLKRRWRGPRAAITPPRGGSSLKVDASKAGLTRLWFLSVAFAIPRGDRGIDHVAEKGCVDMAVVLLTMNYALTHFRDGGRRSHSWIRTNEYAPEALLRGHQRHAVGCDARKGDGAGAE